MKEASMERMVRRLGELGEQSAGELGQELWLKEYRGGIPENTLATRYCRPAGKLLKEAERRGWVTSRFGRNRRLWRVTPAGRKAAWTANEQNFMTPMMELFVMMIAGFVAAYFLIRFYSACGKIDQIHDKLFKDDK